MNFVSVNSCRVRIAPSVAVGISKHKVAIGGKKRTISDLSPLSREFLGGVTEDVFIICC